jgi:hypothetical protein
MASPEALSRLEDILEAIDTIGVYTSGKTQTNYAAERMLRDAVERTSSASPKHRDMFPSASQPNIPGFHGVRSPASVTSCGTPIRSSTTA